MVLGGVVFGCKHDDNLFNGTMEKKKAMTDRKDGHIHEPVTLSCIHCYNETKDTQYNALLDNVQGLEEENRQLESVNKAINSFAEDREGRRIRNEARIKKLEEALEKIASGKIEGCEGQAHNKYCECAEELAKQALNKLQGDGK
jgi:hypothetical protein